MKVNVDYGRCEGHGMCVMQAAVAFDLDDEGELQYEFDGQDVPAEMEGDVRSAVDACPVAARTEAH